MTIPNLAHHQTVKLTLNHPPILPIEPQQDGLNNNLCESPFPECRWADPNSKRGERTIHHGYSVLNHDPAIHQSGENYLKMAVSTLICDDSAMARKQISRALPEEWLGSIRMASNGVEALEVIRTGGGDLVFLDLTMPEMDGFQVLETIRREDLNTLVFVVSADVQPEARARVMELGALDFIRKPVDKERLRSAMKSCGLL